jgi:hypothetical protein
MSGVPALRFTVILGLVLSLYERVLSLYRREDMDEILQLLPIVVEIHGGALIMPCL